MTPSLRHDARMTSPRSAPTTAARPRSSASRAATSPTIPTPHGPRTRVAGASGSSATRARASATAAFMRSRRSPFASLEGIGMGGRPRRRRRPAGVGPPPSPRPTRPAALSRGASANETVSRSTRAGATRARSSRAAMPGRGADRSRSRPSRAIARFSPTIGATSATVPIVARSVRARAAAGPPGTSRRSSWATLKATPLPARRESGYVRVGAVRVHQGDRVGQDLGHAVVIRHDDVEPALAGDGDLRVARRSAVDGHDDRRAGRSRPPRSPPATGHGPRRAGSGRTARRRRRTGARRGS